MRVSGHMHWPTTGSQTPCVVQPTGHARGRAMAPAHARRRVQRGTPPGDASRGCLQGMPPGAWGAPCWLHATQGGKRAPSRFFRRKGGPQNTKAERGQSDRHVQDSVSHGGHSTPTTSQTRLSHVVAHARQVGGVKDGPYSISLGTRLCHGAEMVAQGRIGRGIGRN